MPRIECKSFLHHVQLFVAALAACVMTSAGSARGEDWAKELGYPAGKKVVILHAHDMGLCFETNQAVGKLLASQPKTSASAMAPCPWFAHATKQQSSSPGSDIGLQLTLNSEWSQYRWRPLGAEALTRSLRNSRGYMWRSIIQVAVNAQAEDVEHELNAQLLHAERMGFRPSHLTTHLGALYSRPDLAEMYLEFARRRWIPAVVIELTPELAARFASNGFPVPDSLTRIIENYPLPKIKDLRILPRTETFEEKVSLTLKLIDKLPVGLSQIAFSPATESPALKAITPSWQQFVWDHNVMQDERIVNRLKGKDVVITNWVEVMKRFDSGSR